MRSVRLFMIGLVATTRVALADPAQEIAQRGELLARDGRLTEAIDQFKEADRLAPRTSYACLIGLAYLRRELFTQAELFLARCRERSSRTDPAPDWLPLAEQQLKQLAASSHLAAVDVRVEPAQPGAAISISSFSLDERFAPRRVRLPRGLHVVTATAPDRRPVRTIVEVKDQTAQRIVLRFDERDSSAVPSFLAGAGGLTLAAGLGYQVFTREPRDRAEREEKRNVTYALYGAGGAAVLTGLVLRYTVYRSSPESAPLVSARVGSDATTLALEWRR